MAIQHYIAKEAYYRKIFREKKWRSHNDLEYIEIQGVKDLGFDLDEQELNASTARAPYGRGGRKAEIDGQKSTEKISCGPVIFRYVDKRSAEDMKKQLKFWAMAVASNARQQF